MSSQGNVYQRFSFMYNLFGQFVLRDLYKNRVRSFITIFGIALGVSVLLAISLANHTVIAKFKETVDQVSGKANLEIRPSTTTDLDESLLESVGWLRQLDGKFMPMIDKNVIYPGSTEEIVQFLGIDMLGDPEFKTYGSVSAEEPDDALQGDKSASKNSLAIFRPRAVFVGAKLAAKHSLAQGQTFDLLINNAMQKFKVAGVLSAGGLGGAYSGNLIVADVGLAQEVLHMPGKISAIEIIVPEDQLVDVKEKLSQELSKTVTVLRPSQRGEQIEKITRSFEYNLLALSFVALMVGMFLIYNTMSITVLRRRQEIGTLRALGVSRTQIFAMFTLEALAFGVLGTGAGIAGGLAISGAALAAISKTVQYFYFQQPIETVTVNGWVLIAAFFGGVLLTFVASLPPLLEATRVAPAEAVRRASEELRIFKKANALALFGLLLFLLGYVASLQSPVYNFPVFGYGAALCSILAAAFLLPFILQYCLPAVARLLGLLHQPEGKLAALSLYGTLGRTSVAVASLTIGIAMMVSLAIMIGSFRQTVTTWIDQTLKADLWMQSAARASGSNSARLDGSLVKTLGEIPGIAAVDGFVELPILFKGDKTNLAAADFAVIKNFGHMHFISGESNHAVASRITGNAALISETFSIHHQLNQGDQIDIETPSGPVSLKVEGVYYDYASDLGYIVIDREFYKQKFGDSEISSCAIYLKPGANAADIRAEIMNRAGVKNMISVRTTRELRGEAMKIFDRTFSITYALHTIAITVAMLAVMNALFALTIESKREFGILRYLGARQEQMRKLVLFQAGFLGLFGNLGGLGLGVVLSYLLIYVINKQSFGWTIRLSVPYDFLLESSIMVVLTAIISGLIPARIAAKTVAPQVVRDE